MWFDYVMYRIVDVICIVFPFLFDPRWRSNVLCCTGNILGLPVRGCIWLNSRRLTIRLGTHLNGRWSWQRLLAPHNEELLEPPPPLDSEERERKGEKRDRLELLVIYMICTFSVIVHTYCDCFTYAIQRASYWIVYVCVYTHNILCLLHIYYSIWKTHSFTMWQCST